MADKLQLPDETKRTAIIGKTGSGKTIAALWLFSLMNWLEQPWYVLDFKGDPSIARLASLPEVEERDLEDPITSEPGIYIVRAQPDDKGGELEEFLWRIWAHGSVGLYIDEGYMVGDGRAFRALLTQGRSKRIPMIILSQRPVWMSRFVFSEADFYQYFWVNDKEDRKRVEAFLPADLSERLPRYHSIWYDVGEDKTNALQPVPDLPDILRTFETKLEILAQNRMTGIEEETQPKNGRVFL